MNQKRIVYAWTYYCISGHNGDPYGYKTVYTEDPNIQPQMTQYMQWDEIYRDTKEDKQTSKDLEKLNKGLVR